MFITNGRDNVKNYMSLGKVQMSCRMICLEVLMLLPSGQIECGWRGQLRLVNLNQVPYQDPHPPLWGHFPWAVCSFSCDAGWPLR